MKSEDENMDLEKEEPTLAKMSNINMFKIPDGYFEQSNQQILSRINLDCGAGSSNNFTVPEGYFENLTNQIQSAVYLDELKVSNSENFGLNVPQNYFAEAEKRIIKNISLPKAAKTVKLHFIRYAAAACILFTTTLGIYFNIKQNTTVEYQLSKIPAHEIEAYLNQHMESNDLPMIIENIDDASDIDIDDFDIENAN